MASPIEHVYATLLSREYQVRLFGDLAGVCRKGEGYIAGCPFHSDAVPTLIIPDTRPEFFCFACGARGDWIDYLMRRKGLDFEQAFALLARDAGREQAQCRRDVWTSECTRALALEGFMEACMAALWDMEGRSQFQALVARGYATDEIRRMGIGCFLGYEAAAAQHPAASFIDPDAQPGVLIPYRDSAGRLMGLVCKDMAQRGPGSYAVISSWDGMERTPFLAHRLRGAREALVVEGFFDALLVEAIGVVPVVGTGSGPIGPGMIEAAVGTGCTRFTVVVSNKAGAPARARKTIACMVSLGLDTRVLPVPPGYDDLDEFIRSTCLDGFLELLTQAGPARAWLGSEGSPG